MKVTLSFPEWTEGNVAPATYVIPVDPPRRSLPPDAERLASARLDLAKALLARDRQSTSARVRLQAVVDQYPATKAAAEAKDLLLERPRSRMGR